jgi:hypothetical protein
VHPLVVAAVLRELVGGVPTCSVQGFEGTPHIMVGRASRGTGYPLPLELRAMGSTSCIGGRLGWSGSCLLPRR